MSQHSIPCKELVRDWLRQRRLAGCPPPSIAQIRQAVGWRVRSIGMDEAVADHPLKRIKGGFRRIANTELGEEQRCRSCGEWWPVDQEFFVVTESSLGYDCKACLRERKHAKKPFQRGRS